MAELSVDRRWVEITGESSAKFAIPPEGSEADQMLIEEDGNEIELFAMRQQANYEFYEFRSGDPNDPLNHIALRTTRPLPDTAATLAYALSQCREEVKKLIANDPDAINIEFSHDIGAEATLHYSPEDGVQETLDNRAIAVLGFAPDNGLVPAAQLHVERDWEDDLEVQVWVETKMLHKVKTSVLEVHIGQHDGRVVKVETPEVSFDKWALIGATALAIDYIGKNKG